MTYSCLYTSLQEWSLLKFHYHLTVLTVILEISSFVSPLALKV